MIEANSNLRPTSEAGIITGYLLLKTKQIDYIEYRIEVILLLRKEMKKEWMDDVVESIEDTLIEMLTIK